MNCGIRAKLHDVPALLATDIKRVDEIWRYGLGQFGGPYLAGERFTAADAFYAPVVFRVNSYDLELSKVSQQYVRSMLQEPAMQEWLAAALDEPWREQGHEQDIHRYATLLEDNRH
jgi:glutathione S-transferase